MSAKKFYRIKKDKMICGVCTGLSEYFNIDITLIRIAWVFFTLMGGSGILAYLIISLISPSKYSAGDES